MVVWTRVGSKGAGGKEGGMTLDWEMDLVELGDRRQVNEKEM